MANQFFLLQVSCFPLFGGIVFIVLLFLIGAVGFIIGQIRRFAAVVTIFLSFWMGTTVLSWIKLNPEMQLCTIGLSNKTLEYMVLTVMIISILLSITGVIMRTVAGEDIQKIGRQEDNQ